MPPPAIYLPIIVPFSPLAAEMTVGVPPISGGNTNWATLPGNAPESMARYLGVGQGQQGEPQPGLMDGANRIFLQLPSSASTQTVTASITTVDGQVITPEMLARTVGGAENATPLTTFVMTAGRETVFRQPTAASTLFPGAHAASSLPQTAGRPDSPSVAAGRPDGGATQLGGGRATERQTVPQMAAAAKAAAAAQTQGHLPAVVCDILARLEILPPGVRPEEVLPRLQEVVRLWVQGSRNTDLPPDVVRVVNHFLLSAVLLANLSNPESQAPRLSRHEAAASSTGTLSQGLEGFQGRQTHAPMLHLSTANIAQAVLSILSGSHATPVMNQAPVPQTAQPVPQRGADPQGASAQRSNVAAPSVRSGAENHPQRTARPQSGGQAATDFFKAQKGSPDAVRSYGRSEEDRRRDDVDEADIRPLAPHERESFAGSGGGEQEDEEALFGRAIEILEKGMFIVKSEGRIGLRTLRDTDAVPLVELLAALVPSGNDILDLLEIMALQGFGWGEERGPVNAALQRLANYRTLGNGTKSDALLEPLRDVVIVLGMNEMGLSPEEDLVLQRFEAHLPVVEMYLGDEAWIGRLEDDRDILAEELADSRSQWERHLKRVAPRRIVSMPGSEGSRLLN